ncbi:MAG: hypothetical protein J6Q81_05725 [Lentisphaeria bacterium]|nr:hypothetical protein [Lentisphaeria bacterium]
MEVLNGIVLGLLAGSAFAALLSNRIDRAANVFGAGGCIAALLLKFFIAVREPDVLQLCFQLPIIFVGIAAAWHSIGYMADHGRHRMNLYWFLFNLTIFAMMAVTMQSKPGAVFLLTWELMGLTSFGLVAFDWGKDQVRQASWIYLLACEAGGLLLVWVLVSMLNGNMPAATAAIIIAFGLKCGFPLLHVWLPEAHPAAPAPVSAVMSAAMIPLGFYGIGVWAPWIMDLQAVGWVFFVAGLVGMLGGILFGAAQSNLKRLLAYSSVENIGIITLAFGLAILCRTVGNELMMITAAAGGALHVVNHALLKGALFLGAGSVYKSMHTLDMDVMGGLVRKMPATGLIFTIGGMGISGLPPFCGFASELLIYLAAFQGIAYGSGGIFAASLAAVIALALTGGMAAAAFAKSISAVFAGEPRSEAVSHAEKESLSMVLAQAFLLVLALLMTLAAPFLIAFFVGYNSHDMLILPLVCNAIFAIVLCWLVFGFMMFRKARSKKRPDAENLTWDCGFAEPTARMQYTAAAFIQPLADLFNGVLKQKKSVAPVTELFPVKAYFSVETPDGAGRWLWAPLFKAASFVSDKVKRLQSGFLHIYILIMVVAILLMLGWSFISKSAPAEKTAGKSIPAVKAVEK